MFEPAFVFRLVGEEVGVGRQRGRDEVDEVITGDVVVRLIVREELRVGALAVGRDELRHVKRIADPVERRGRAQHRALGAVLHRDVLADNLAGLAIKPFAFFGGFDAFGQANKQTAMKLSLQLQQRRRYRRLCHQTMPGRCTDAALLKNRDKITQLTCIHSYYLYQQQVVYDLTLYAAFIRWQSQSLRQDQS